MKRVILPLLPLLLSSIIAASTYSQTNNSLVKLEGQVVCCAECWAKADRKTTPFGTVEDLEQAKSCVAGGDPTLLAVANDAGGWTLYELQLGKFKRAEKNWLGYVGKHVTVTGTPRSLRNRR